MSEGNASTNEMFQLILAKMENIDNKLSEFDARIQSVERMSEENKTGASSNNNQSNLPHEQVSFTDSSELQTSNSTKEKSDGPKVLNNETMISGIKHVKTWENAQITDKEPLSIIHPELVNCHEMRDETEIISANEKITTSTEALGTFISQLHQMKEDGHFASFTTDSKESNFTDHNPKQIFLDLYQTMAKAQKNKETYDLVPIAYLTGSIAAAGGFNFSDPKHADILTNLAITSEIYLEAKELYKFVKALKPTIFNFLMKDLGWKDRPNLASCETLRELIDAVYNIVSTPLHPSLKFVALQKNNKDKTTLSDIIAGTDELVNERYAKYNTTKVRYTSDVELWLTDSMNRTLDKLNDDSVSDAEKKKIVDEIKEYISNTHKHLAECDIYYWVSQMKAAFYDEKLNPKMYELWSTFNKRIITHPNEYFAVWFTNFFSPLTDIKKNIAVGQIFNLFQVKLKGINVGPGETFPDFKLPVNYSLNAVVANTSNKSKTKKKTTGKSTAQKPTNLSSI